MSRVDLNFDAKSIQIDYSDRYTIDVNVGDVILQEVIDSINDPFGVLDCIEEDMIVGYLENAGYIVQKERKCL